MIIREMLKPPRSVVDSKIMLLLMAIASFFLHGLEPVMPEDIHYKEIWPDIRELPEHDYLLMRGLITLCSVYMREDVTLGCLRRATVHPDVTIIDYTEPEEIPPRLDGLLPEEYRGMLLGLRIE